MLAANIINKGRGGIFAHQTTKILSTEVLPLKPKRIIVQIGINNILEQANNVAILAIQSFIQDFIKICHNNNIEPVLSTVIPVSKKFLLPYSRLIILKEDHYQTANATVAKVNVWLRTFSDQHHIALIDYAEALRKKDNSFYNGDGVHLSATGNELIWQINQPYLLINNSTVTKDKTTLITPSD